MFTVSTQNNVHSTLNNRCICITISCGKGRAWDDRAENPGRMQNWARAVSAAA